MEPSPFWEKRRIDQPDSWSAMISLGVFFQQSDYIGIEARCLVEIRFTITSKDHV